MTAGLLVRATILALMHRYRAISLAALKALGLDALALVNAAEKALGQTLNIRPEDILQVRVEAVHSEAKAEAL